MKRGVVAGLLLLLACSEEFNPVVEGERPFVVFALLNVSSTTQIVRVHETASPTERDPKNRPIPGTVVRIVGPEGTLLFRDTVLIPPPGSADTSSVNAYVLDPFTPTRGATYTLNVASPRGTATATMSVPNVVDITTRDFLVLQGPYAYSPEKSLSVGSILDPLALGYVMRLLIEYERNDNGAWIREVVEVPTVYRGPDGEDTYTAVYPALTRRTSAVITNTRGVKESESTVFRNAVYLQTLSILYGMYGKQNLRMKRALIVLTQADRHFFSYYSFANFFQDRLTIRVDQPDYSNVNGALGFFGSLTTDTLAYILPPDLSPPLE